MKTTNLGTALAIAGGGLLLSALVTSSAFAADLSAAGPAASNDYFIAQVKTALPGATQGNEGAFAQIDQNSVLVIRRFGQINLYDAISGTVQELTATVPYTDFTQRWQGERGLSGVKGALFDGATQNLLVSTVQSVDSCARPVIYSLHWDATSKSLSPAKKVVSAPTCVPVNALDANFPPITSDNRQGQPNTSQAGGRIVKVGASSYLWAVGNFGDSWRTLKQMDAAEKNPKDFYGKTISITKGWKTKIFTTGHRNIQGLIRLKNGDVYATEHGAQGGDELNLLVKGSNYGWPHVSLGHTYSSSDSTFRPGVTAPFNQGLVSRKSVAPTFSWVPSIAPSQALTVSSSSRLSSWRNSLLVSTLRDQSLRRLVFMGRNVVADEKISLGFRVRDLVWLGGDILCLDDSSNVVRLHMTARATTASN